MIDAIWTARERLKGVVLRTPLVPLQGAANARVHLKLENLQVGGSFKLRGLYNRMAGVRDELLRRGAKTVSAGNTAIAMALAGREMGISVEVLMPDNAPRAKVEGVRALGGTVVQWAHEPFMDYVLNQGWKNEERCFVHPFDHPDVWAGHGTCGLEILEDLPQVRTVLVAIGGGGLITGVAHAIKALAPHVRVLGVQAANMAPWPEALRRGEVYRVPDPKPTMADGIALPAVFPSVWEAVSGRLDGCLTVTEAEIRGAIRLLVTANKVVAEGAGAVTAAAALKLGPEEGPVAAVISGGNVDPSVLVSILSEQS